MRSRYLDQREGQLQRLILCNKFRVVRKALAESKDT